MPPLPLFYRTVVPLDRHDHRAWRLAQPQRFGFARASHLVPAVLDEFVPACRHLTILFLPEREGPTAVFLTGLAPGRSALVDADGTWTGRYLPAYLRRFPFILGETEAAGDPRETADRGLICLDDTSDLLLRSAETGDRDVAVGEGVGEAAPLFDSDGRDTPLLQERVQLVVEYAEAARRTAALGRALQDLGLLRALTIQGRDPATGESHALHGVLGVDEAALAALPEDALARLHRGGWLPAIHAHLVSLQAASDFTLALGPPGRSASVPHQPL